MTVKELQEALTTALKKGTLKPDSMVVMSIDSEGNGHSEAMELSNALIVDHDRYVEIVGYTDKHGMDIFFKAKPKEYKTALIMCPTI